MANLHWAFGDRVRRLIDPDTGQISFEDFYNCSKPSKYRTLEARIPWPDVGSPQLTLTVHMTGCNFDDWQTEPVPAKLPADRDDFGVKCTFCLAPPEPRQSLFNNYTIDEADYDWVRQKHLLPLTKPTRVLIDGNLFDVNHYNASNLRLMVLDDFTALPDRWGIGTTQHYMSVSGLRQRRREAALPLAWQLRKGHRAWEFDH